MSSHGAATQAGLITHLNPVITGWCQYYASVVSKEVFASMSHYLFEHLLRWAKHRHPRLNTHQIVSRYWRVNQGDGWVFQTNGELKLRRHHETDIPHFQLAHRIFQRSNGTCRNSGQMIISISPTHSQLRTNSSCELKNVYPLPEESFKLKYLSVTLKVRNMG
ncbi:MAG TPA: hypothetical protein IGS53_19220 [Leptolyngbyaceae cyanobacterium M33_DOE_097]|nr:hypothetical protein [Leptolyngbyaceae cyanobacterium M33_DOE_097]